jgi:hypothetical protein
MEKIFAITPRRTIIYVLLCLSGILFIILVGIMPKHFSLARLDQKIKSVQFQIEEQKSLYPVYQDLQKRTQARDSKVLPSPARGTLLRTQLNAIPATFRDIARKANLDMVSASPDLNSLSSESRLLQVNAVIRGNFFNFRKFLIGLGEVPYLERIEEIQIQQNEDTMEFKMKIWLALAQGSGD